MGDPIVEQIEPLTTQKLADDPSWMRIVTHLTRVGMRLFSVALEFNCYKPETPANDNFLIEFCLWKEMCWQIISIPIADKEKAFEIAKQTGMKLQHAIPLVAGGGGKVLFAASLALEKFGAFDPADIFPMRSKTVYTLENDPKGKYSMIYKGELGVKHVKEFEEAEVAKIHDDYRDWCRTNGLRVPGPHAFE